MGAIHRREEPVRSTYNRQARRASLCIGGFRKPRGRKRPISPGRVALTAHGPGLVEAAACAAYEIELPAELNDLLSIDLSVPALCLAAGRTFERELQVLTRSGNRR